MAAGTAGLMTMPALGDGAIKEEVAGASFDPAPFAKQSIKFAVIGLDHYHIMGMTAAVQRGGGKLVKFYTTDPKQIADFRKQFGDIKLAKSEDEILNDKSIRLVCGAPIPDQRAPLGIRVMKAEFPTGGLWNVHGKFLTHARYADGVTMDISGDFPNGVKFIGTKGWIFVARTGEGVSPTDPKATTAAQPLQASDPRILDSVIGPNEIHLYASTEQHADWIQAIRTRGAMATDAEIGHRTCSTCLVHSIAMHLKRRLHWDPIAERFNHDDEANKMLNRPQRAPYTFG